MNEFFRWIFKNYSFKIKYGLSQGMRRAGALGLKYSIIPRKLTNEEIFLKNFNFQNMIVYDIGGYEGIYTIFFAKSVGSEGKVYVFEPNPLNYEIILKNLNLNDITNVELNQMAIGESHRSSQFVYPNISFGTGTLDKEIQQQIINEKNYSLIEVNVESIDNLVINKKILRPDFVKIDTEGLELEILRGMQYTLSTFKPNLFIEIHGADVNDKIKNANEIFQFLTKYNYSFYHVETQHSVLPENTDLPIQGHLFCK